jgi:hypothetical protein
MGRELRAFIRRAHQAVQRDQVALHAEADDDAGGGGGDVGVVPERLARMHVGDVALDHRQAVHALDGVVHCAKAPGLNTQPRALPALKASVLLDLVDQGPFPVALEALDL